MASYVALSNTGTNFNDQDIINVGDLALDSISSDDGVIVIGDGNDAITLNPTASVRFSDKNLMNVGNVALDSISSSAGTNIAVTLGTDAGDDLIVATDALVVEGDNKNVGIGTAAPAKNLHVYGSSGEVELRIQSDTSFCSIIQKDNNELIIQNAASGGVMIFHDDTAERMRIDSDGKVGIGVNDPDAHMELFATTKQLKMSYDASNEASFTVDSGGDLTIVPSGGDVAVTGTLNVSAGIEVTTKTAVAGASASASTAGSASSNTRSGTLTVTMQGGHTWSSGANAMTVVLNNTAIDADSVVVVSSQMANTIFHVSTIADNSCKLHASANSSGGDIAPSGTFAINFLVM
tara:strand:- start:1172 stop:2218 length:1047 start_codon:yes stop_codon:yes gene_type:complete